MNRHMNFICGRQCPAGEGCTNRSLTRRPQKAYKIAWTGTRGFGMFAAEDIAEGEFVMDYRGEVSHPREFCNRIDNEYKGTRNFYALHYDGDEVVDAGMRGNDARFINHGCSPNLEVRKLQTVGDGFEEYEIGFWAIRDIKAGEELLYDYNFEAFTVGDLANEDVRVRCQCGASNCIGFMGRRSGEKSAKELARDLGRQTEMRGQKRKAPPTTEGARAVFTKRRPGKARQPVLTPAAAAGSGTSGTLDASGNLILPVKRKVGRPRIHPLPDPNAPRRKPGRPRIHPLPDPSAPKRKPGRPRKHPLPAPVNDVPATDSGDPAPPVASETPAAALDAATPSETPVPDARASPAGATARAPLPVATPPSATLQPPPKAPKTFWVANSREQAPATAATPAPGPAPRAPRAVAIPATSAAAAAAVAPTPSPPPVTAPTSAPVPALVSAPPPTLSPVSPVTVKKEDNESDWEDATTVGSHRISATNKRRAPSKSGPPGKKRGPGRPRKIPPPTPPPPPPPGAKRGPGRPRKIRNPEDELPVLGPRITPKQAEKIKRNGAPAGWVFVPVGPPAAAPAEAAPAPREATPPPSARARRAQRLASVRQATPGVL
ncbi:uncharacterized protein COLE_03965 [Cutaneotrichosporon oleaginosum]|uniref:uncharacterized protein n=1 Tax=Cutaneotrichosporon oleaginosum TaxID=879819 RepID=UPI001329A5B2|nr:hypothetical protein COLE_03965 [Cutaneotrichosporon oleaginosum]